MKKILLAGLMIFTAMAAFGKLDGKYLSDITRDYQTPHLSWAEKLSGGKLRVLFIVARMGGREVTEIAQRLELDFTAVTARSAGTLAEGHDFMFESPVAGTSRYEKERELLQKLEKNYDLIVLGNFNFHALPEEAQYKILSRVKEGCGLMSVQPVPRPLKYRKVFAQPVPGAENIMSFVSSAGFFEKVRKLSRDEMLKTFQFGKGRIITVDYNYKWNDSPHLSAVHVGTSLTPPFMYSNKWPAEYENLLVMLMRSMLWAAARESAVSLEPGELKDNPTLTRDQHEFSLAATARQKTSAEIEWRVRNEYNEVLGGGKIPLKIDGQQKFKIKVPPLFAGNYYLDVICVIDGKADNFGFYAFNVKSPLGAGEIITDSESIKKRGKINAEFRIAEASDKKLKVAAELKDSPYGRIWYRKEYLLEPGQKSLKFEVKNYHLPTIAGYLRCRVFDESGAPMVQAEKLLFFPDYTLEPYLELLFGSIDGNYLAALYAPQIVDVAGWRAGIGGGRMAAMFNMRAVPYMTRINIGKGEKSEVTLSFLPKKESSAERAALKGDECFYRPEVQKLTAELIQQKMTNLPDYGPLIYSLGDENSFSREAGYGPSDEKYFREFLKQKYGSIKKLKLEWNEKYNSFEEVRHYPLKEAQEQGRFPAWYDQRQYMEKMYADVHHFWAREIKKYDPEARVGAEGSQPGDLELTISRLEFWGPYNDFIMNEVLRSLGKDKVRTSWWGGYTGSGRPEFPFYIWTCLLKGTVNGNAWYQATPAGCESAMSTDMSFADYFKKYLPHLKELQNGLAQLLIETPLNNDKIAILWSHASDSAGKLDKKFTTDSLVAFMKFCYRQGLNFEFVTEATLDRLNHAGILMLFGASALSEKEADAIKGFVKNGGTVVADLNPGILNNYLRPLDKNPLAELFGDLSFSEAQAPVLKKISIDAGFKGKHLKFTAEKAYSAPDKANFIVKEYGRGTAALLNFSLGAVANTALPETPFDKFMLDLLGTCGVSPEISAEGIDKNTSIILRVRKADDGYQVAGITAGNRDVGKTVHLNVNKTKYIYEAGKGLVGENNKIAVNFAVPFHVYCLFDAPQKPPEFSLSSETINAGEQLAVVFDATSKNRVRYLQIIDAEGKVLALRDTVIDKGAAEFPLYFAYNDRKGKYKISVKDIATGLVSEKAVELK